MSVYELFLLLIFPLHTEIEFSVSNGGLASVVKAQVHKFGDAAVNIVIPIFIIENYNTSLLEHLRSLLSTNTILLATSKSKGEGHSVSGHENAVSESFNHARVKRITSDDNFINVKKLQELLIKDNWEQFAL
ncbi:hypothetical protein DICVIV_09230 [Dictyocaulus viviparus]|uniref:Uncharacterized protein n=1 Tax=Dictyocaulus viviparus TaxID=29172 RepID=A0A0D8XLT2_DICVI|nr:hypothetical protein DICVIV_09230 [Dictyocaulus viviparus]